MADENETPQAEAESTSPAEETAPATPVAEAPDAAAPDAAAQSEESQPKVDAALGDEPKSAESAAPAKEGEAAPAKEGEVAKGPPKKKDIFAEIDPKDAEAPKIVKAKGSKNVTAGIVHVSATFNNTIVSVTDRQGNVLGWSSSGKMGFRGSRKSTAYASQLVSQDACRQAMSHGLKEAEVRVKGPGSGREAAARAVQNLGIEVTVIKDVTPIPHNGCRPPKARRV